MDVHETPLQANVININETNQEALSLQEELREVFKPWVGKKIIKSDGSLLKALEKLLPEHERSPRIRYWQVYGQHRLEFTVKGRQMYKGHRQGDQFATYYETHASIGIIKNQVLIARCVDTPQTEKRRTDWTVEEVEAKREAVRQAKQALRDAESALRPFDLR